MSDAPTLVARREASPTAAGVADRVRWALLIAWVVMLGYCIGFGERPSTLGHLERAVVAGEVHDVQVGPSALPPGARGYGTQQVQWREGLWRHRADVTMVASPDASGPQDTDNPVRRGHDLATVLPAEHPGLEVSRVPSSTNGGELYGWQLPQGWAWASLALILTTIFLLVGEPRPRWATRWAWFWLMLTPVGTLLYLVAAGPTPGIPEPRTHRIILRGGWALVLGAVSASLLPTWWGQA